MKFDSISRGGESRNVLNIQIGSFIVSLFLGLKQNIISVSGPFFLINTASKMGSLIPTQ